MVSYVTMLSKDCIDKLSDVTDGILSNNSKEPYFFKVSCVRFGNEISAFEEVSFSVVSGLYGIIFLGLY